MPGGFKSRKSILAKKKAERRWTASSAAADAASSNAEPEPETEPESEPEGEPEPGSGSVSVQAGTSLFLALLLKEIVQR